MKLLWALFVSAFALTASAQSASKCEENFKAFEEKVLSSGYNDAHLLMADLRKSCPKVSDKLYAYGEKVLKYKIEASRLPEEKQKLIDDLVALYAEQDKNFPGTGGEVKKTLLQYEHKKIADDEAYAALAASFNKNRSAFTDYNALETYFILLQKQYKGSKGMTDEQFIQRYGDITSQIGFAKNKITNEKDAVLKKQETQMITDTERQVVKDAQPAIDALSAVEDNINKMASTVFSCDKMEAYYSNAYDEHKEDAVWLEGMANVMFGNKCYSSPVLNKGALAIHAMKPTSQTAYRLGVLTLRKHNNKEAMPYFEQAVALEPNPVKKADLHMEMANIFRNNDKTEAKKHALLAAGLNPKSGKPHLLLANMYSSVLKECQLSDFERKALVWLSIDAAKKAELAEPKFKTTVAALMKGYAKKAPTKEELKASGRKKGDTITYGCWINETLTIPNL